MSTGLYGNLSTNKVENQDYMDIPKKEGSGSYLNGIFSSPLNNNGHLSAFGQWQELSHTDYKIKYKITNTHFSSFISEVHIKN